MEIIKHTDQELIEIVRNDSNRLREIYKGKKGYSIQFMQKIKIGNSIEQEELVDIYQDAMIIFYEKIVDRDFKLTSSIQTYLNSVCRFQLLNRSKKIKSTINIGEDGNDKYHQYDPEIEDTLIELRDVKDSKHIALEKALFTLKKEGRKCFELLTLFFYHKKSMKEIAERLGYTNAANAKSQKSKCQKRLKNMSYKNYNS